MFTQANVVAKNTSVIKTNITCITVTVDTQDIEDIGKGYIHVGVGV